MIATTPGSVYLKKRRRYNVGRYVRKKYGGKRAPYKRRITASKAIVNDVTNVVCSSDDKISLVQDGSYRSDNTGNSKFRNLYTILQASSEFNTRAQQYSFFKLTGLTVKFTRRWLNPITYGVDTVESGILQNTYQYGLAMLNVNFFPTQVSTVHGAVTENSDSSFKVSPYIQTLQTHYIKFPQMITGNGIGLNMWNPTNIAGALQGQLSFYNDPGCSVSDTTEHFIIWDVEYNVYVQFCNNNGF